MDSIIFLWLNSLVAVDPLLDGTILFFAKYHIYVMTGGVVTIFIILGRYGAFNASGVPSLEGSGLEKSRSSLLYILYIVLSASVARFGITELIRILYDRPRPFEVMGGVRQLIEHSTGSSFPSGHTVFAFALAAAVYFFLCMEERRTVVLPRQVIFLFFWLSAILVGISRIAAGVHWPSDVLGGAMVGVVTAWLLHQVIWKLKAAD